MKTKAGRGGGTGHFSWLLRKAREKKAFENLNLKFTSIEENKRLENLHSTKQRPNLFSKLQKVLILALVQDDGFLYLRILQQQWEPSNTHKSQVSNFNPVHRFSVQRRDAVNVQSL